MYKGVLRTGLLVAPHSHMAVHSIRHSAGALDNIGFVRPFNYHNRAEAYTEQSITGEL